MKKAVWKTTSWTMDRSGADSLPLPSPYSSLLCLAAADGYPQKPVRLLIAFAPGGSTDAIGRLIATKLSERLGKQFVAENQAGAGGTMASEMVAQIGARRSHAAVQLFGHRRSTPCSPGAVRSHEVLHPDRQDRQCGVDPGRPSVGSGQFRRRNSSRWPRNSPASWWLRLRAAAASSIFPRSSSR